MASHTLHPDIHTYGLNDDCDRCWQLAGEPLDELDQEALMALVASVQQDLPPRSSSEAYAMARIRAALYDATRLMRLGFKLTNERETL